ncbi:Hypothetical_protein [Hexamita inflata]|uniref:Hypothetical_protein n=1 Tax=Hexamita inflata TaxID=28002 RepID=A0AA86THI5_9EUKA|nr:Hypothetical protein HINF_LOCUS6359 [Hexamita inflata]
MEYWVTLKNSQTAIAHQVQYDNQYYIPVIKFGNVYKQLDDTILQDTPSSVIQRLIPYSIFNNTYKNDNHYINLLNQTQNLVYFQKHGVNMKCAINYVAQKYEKAYFGPVQLSFNTFNDKQDVFTNDFIKYFQTQQVDKNISPFLYALLTFLKSVHVIIKGQQYQYIDVCQFRFGYENQKITYFEIIFPTTNDQSLVSYDVQSALGRKLQNIPDYQKLIAIMSLIQRINTQYKGITEKQVQSFKQIHDQAIEQLGFAVFNEDEQFIEYIAKFLVKHIQPLKFMHNTSKNIIKDPQPIVLNSQNAPQLSNNQTNLGFQIQEQTIKDQTVQNDIKVNENIATYTNFQYIQQHGIKLNKPNKRITIEQVSCDQSILTCDQTILNTKKITNTSSLQKYPNNKMKIGQTDTYYYSVKVQTGQNIEICHKFHREPQKIHEHQRDKSIQVGNEIDPLLGRPTVRHPNVKIFPIDMEKLQNIMKTPVISSRFSFSSEKIEENLNIQQNKYTVLKDLEHFFKRRALESESSFHSNVPAEESSTTHDESSSARQSEDVTNDSGQQVVKTNANQSKLRIQNKYEMDEGLQNLIEVLQHQNQYFDETELSTSKKKQYKQPNIQNITNNLNDLLKSGELIKLRNKIIERRQNNQLASNEDNIDEQSLPKLEIIASKKQQHTLPKVNKTLELMWQQQLKQQQQEQEQQTLVQANLNLLEELCYIDEKEYLFNQNIEDKKEPDRQDLHKLTKKISFVKYDPNKEATDFDIRLLTEQLLNSSRDNVFSNRSSVCEFQTIQK